MADKRRLDQAVLSAGLADSRERARALILSGRVLVDGQRRDKPGHSISDDARIELRPGKRTYASRGGDKLASVLEPLGVDPSGKRCLDVGSSTGGFTDVLLQNGATHCTCVDVGKGLLDHKLRQDERVTLVEQVNARHLQPEQVSPPYDLATVDVSFISMTLVLPAILPLVHEDGCVLGMVKPQFEVGRSDVGKGGVVRDPAKRVEAVAKVARCMEEHGWKIAGVKASGLAGPKGNREVFLLARNETELDAAELSSAIEMECSLEPS